MKKIFTIGFMLAAIITSSYALAANKVFVGSISQLYADPSDAIFRLSVNSQCGSNYFVLERSNNNFEEMYSLLLAAGMGGKNVRVEVIKCSGTRAVVSHGSIYF